MSNFIQSKYYISKYSTTEEILSLIDNMTSISDIIKLIMVLGLPVFDSKWSAAFNAYTICVEINDYYIYLTNTLFDLTRQDMIYDRDHTRMYICKNNDICALSNFELDARTVNLLRNIIGRSWYTKNENKKFMKIVREAAERNQKIKQAYIEEKANINCKVSRNHEKFSFDYDYYSMTHPTDAFKSSTTMNDIYESYTDLRMSQQWN